MCVGAPIDFPKKAELMLRTGSFCLFSTNYTVFKFFPDNSAPSNRL